MAAHNLSRQPLEHQLSGTRTGRDTFRNPAILGALLLFFLCFAFAMVHEPDYVPLADGHDAATLTIPKRCEIARRHLHDELSCHSVPAIDKGLCRQW